MPSHVKQKPTSVAKPKAMNDSHGLGNLARYPSQHFRRIICPCVVGTNRRACEWVDEARGMLQQICEDYPISRLPEGVDRLRKEQVAGRIVVNFNWED